MKKKLAGFVLFGFFLLIMLVSPVWPGTNVRAVIATPDSQYTYVILTSDNTVEITEYMGNGTTVNIPKTIDGMPVTSIGKKAFYECDTVTSVTIPDSVTTIGAEAFWDCDALTSVTIPDGVITIGADAFWNCDALTSVTIPGSVTAIEDETFYSCSALKNVTIQNGVTSIGMTAFAYCKSLTDITIPGSVDTIGPSAFYNCTSLANVTIQNGVTSIGDWAFMGCNALMRITIPNSVTSIGERAFESCGLLTWVTLPENIDYIGEGAFRKCSSLTSITIPGGEIAASAFANCSYLKSVTLLDGVTRIGARAFEACRSLTSITIPESVDSIREYAFKGCESLVSITIPDGIKQIEANTFSYCDALEDVTLPNSVTSIGNYAFYYCLSLEEITLPDRLRTIGGHAFEQCRLTNVVIPDTVGTIYEYAFSQCVLDGVVIPSSVTAMGDDIFYSTGIKTIYGESGSRAETYAKEYPSIAFIEIQKDSYDITGAQIAECTGNSIRINWNQNTWFSGYAIEQYKNNKWERIATINNNTTTTYQIRNLLPSTSYQFRICGKGFGGYPTMYGKYTYINGKTRPAAVTGVEIGGRAGDALRINWNKNTGVFGYIIEQYKSGKWERIVIITNNNVNTYRVEKLSPATTYQFRIMSFDFEGGTMVYSGYTTISGKTNPSAVTGAKIGGWASNALRLNWTKNSTAAGYIIEQYKSGKWERIAKITSNATTTYRVENLSPATTYQFRILAFNFDGNTPLYGNYTYVNGKTNPPATTGVKIGGRAADALRLNWTKNPTAAGYIIEQYKSGKWERIAKITSNATTTYRVENLSPCTTYQFRIQSFDIDGNTALYSLYTYINGKTNPSAMTGVKIGGWASNALRLNWTKNPTAAGYIIEQYQSGKWVRIARIANNSTTTYRVENLSPGTTYQFRILAFNFDGSTPLYGNYTYVNGKTNPSATAGVKIGGWAKDALRINWTKNPTAAGYIIEQYQSGKWVRIAKITNNATTTYRVENLSPSTTYQFRIQAFNFDGSTPLYGLYTYVSGETLK